MEKSKWNKWEVTFQLNFCDPPEQHTVFIETTGMPSEEFIIAELSEYERFEHLKPALYSFQLLKCKKAQS